MSRVRPVVERMHGYVPGEQPRGGTVVKLNTNENPYPPAPGVIAAVAACAAADLRLYPDPMATALREAAARRYGVASEHAIPFSADFALPAALADADGRVLIICNPNSPSGTFTPLDVIEDLARGREWIVVVDEAYVDFAPATALPLVARYDNVLVLRSFSKSFSLAGMRIGLAFGHPELLAELAKVKDSYNVSRVAIAAGVAALEDYTWMEQNVARIVASRARLSKELRAVGYDVLPSAANFVLARRPGEDQGAVQAALRERGVLVRHFATPRLADALRISVGTDEEIDRLLAELRALG